VRQMDGKATRSASTDSTVIEYPPSGHMRSVERRWQEPNRAHRLDLASFRLLRQSMPNRAI
jgi:hypothetical protein